MEEDSISNCSSNSNGNINDNQQNEFADYTDEILSRFSSVEKVMENAASVAILMSYRQCTDEDQNYILFYYALKKYKRIIQDPDEKRNYKHYNMEIFTVFVHPKALLHVPIFDPDIYTDIETNIQTNSCLDSYLKALNDIMNTVLLEDIKKLNTAIKNGKEIPYVHSLEGITGIGQEMDLLREVQTFISSSLVRQQKSRCLPTDSHEVRCHMYYFDNQIKAITKGLITQSEYFIHSPKYHGLHTGRISETFLSVSSKSVRKTKIKGHNLHEGSPDTPQFCKMCSSIMWGSYPQGYKCKACHNFYHEICLNNVEECLGDPKISKKDKKEVLVKRASSKGIEGFKMMFGFHDDNNIGNDNVALKSKRNSVLLKEQNTVQNKPINELSKELEEYDEFDDEDKQSTITAIKKPKKNIKHAKSMNVKNVTDKVVDMDIIRTKSTRTPSPEKTNFLSKNKSQIKYGESYFISQSNSINQSFFPSDESNNDEEMDISETFEPEKEILKFSKFDLLPNKENDPQYRRLLVIMEFHHKVKFIRMTLKRFKYCLIDPWQQLNEFQDLFETLSLNTIIQIYSLINDLVTVIDKCTTSSNYDINTASCIYSWFVEDDMANLQTWSRLCIDLCCTNLLHSVRAFWMEVKRTTPSLVQLLSTKVNKMVLVEQLANIRPLLISLPLIVSKIVKDLKNYEKFKDEVKTWEDILKLLRRLPKIIDKRCVPLIHLINSNNVANAISKSNKVISKNPDSLVEKYICNFPKSVFQKGFIDIQYVKISNLSETRCEDSKLLTPAIYVREEIEAAALLYENMVVLLQKDNDKYLLKNFKTVNNKKLIPVFTTCQVHATKKNIDENNFELTIIMITQAILIRLHFKTLNYRDIWYNHIAKSYSKNIKSSPVQYQSSGASDYVESIEEQYCDHLEILNFNKTNKQIDQIQSTLTEVQEAIDKAKNLINEYVSPSISETNMSLYCRPDTFLLGMIEVLSNYSSMACQMVAESRDVEKSLLLQHDVVQYKLPTIRANALRMNAIMNGFSEEHGNRSDEEESLPEMSTSSQGSTTSRESFKSVNRKISSASISTISETFESVEDYVGNVVENAKSKVKRKSPIK